MQSHDNYYGIYIGPIVIIIVKIASLKGLIACSVFAWGISSIFSSILFESLFKTEMVNFFSSR